MEFAQQYWQWIAGLAALAGLIYLLRIRAVRYAHGVRQELHKYLLPDQTPLAPTAVTLPPPYPTDTASMAEKKQALWQEIQKYTLPPDRQIDALVHRLASALVDRQFERAYFLMYGSQQLYLQGLNKQNGTATRQATQEFLDKLGIKDERVKKHVLGNWVAFLISEGFLSARADSFELTVRGQDFLVWIVRQQYGDKTHE